MSEKESRPQQSNPSSILDLKPFIENVIQSPEEFHIRVFYNSGKFFCKVDKYMSEGYT